jgi:nucleotide-binding universal stress UspA family protein
MVGAAPSGDAAVKERRKEMDRSIVCGVDGSPDSQAALAVAIDLATRLQLRLIMANVVEPSHAPYAGAASLGRPAVRPLFPATDQREEAAKKLLVELGATMGREEADRRVVVGYAAERLADLADEEGAEMIVVGSRGRGAFKATFLGSVFDQPDWRRAQPDSGRATRRGGQGANELSEPLGMTRTTRRGSLPIKEASRPVEARVWRLTARSKVGRSRGLMSS